MITKQDGNNQVFKRTSTLFVHVLRWWMLDFVYLCQNIYLIVLHISRSIQVKLFMGLVKACWSGETHKNNESTLTNAQLAQIIIWELSEQCCDYISQHNKPSRVAQIFRIKRNWFENSLVKKTYFTALLYASYKWLLFYVKIMKIFPINDYFLQLFISQCFYSNNLYPNRSINLCSFLNP